MNHLITFKRIAAVALMLMIGFSGKLSAQTCPESNEITITVNPILSIGADLNDAVTIKECVGGNVTLTVTAAGGSGGTLTFAWQENTGAGWGAYTGSGINAPVTSGLTSAITPNTTAAVASIQYRVIITDPASGASNCGSATSKVATVEIKPDLSFGTDLSTTPLVQCLGGNSAISVIVTGGSDNPSSLTYVWEESDSNSPYSWHTAPSATSTASYTPPTTAAGTKYYRVRVQDAGNGCGEAPSAIRPVTTTPELTFNNTPLANITECVGGTDSWTITTTGGSGGSVTYLWEESASNAPYAWGPASGTNNTATYQPSSGAASAGTTRYYRVTVRDAATGCDDLVLGTPVSTTINAKPTATVATAESVVCENGAITFNATITNPGVSCTLEWMSKTPTGAFAPIVPAATGVTYTTPALTPANSGTKYKVRFVCAGSGCCN